MTANEKDPLNIRPVKYPIKVLKDYDPIKEAKRAINIPFIPVVNFEYKVICRGSFESISLEDSLNKYQQEGWENYAVANSGSGGLILFFKKQIK